MPICIEHAHVVLRPIAHRRNMLNLNQYKLRCRIIIAKTFIALRVHTVIE